MPQLEFTPCLNFRHPPRPRSGGRASASCSSDGCEEGPQAQLKCPAPLACGACPHDYLQTLLLGIPLCLLFKALLTMFIINPLMLKRFEEKGIRVDAKIVATNHWVETTHSKKMAHTNGTFTRWHSRTPSKCHRAASKPTVPLCRNTSWRNQQIARVVADVSAAAEVAVKSHHLSGPCHPMESRSYTSDRRTTLARQ